MRRRVLILGLNLLLAACGHDGGSSGVDTNAPVIANLRQGIPNFTPRVGQITPQVFAVDYQDRGDDIGQGYCELIVGSQFTTTQLGFAPGSTTASGIVACLSLGLYRATPMPVTVVLVDGAGHRSNALSITAIVERPS
jgi:hypothetical protein